MLGTHKILRLPLSKYENWNLHIKISYTSTLRLLALRGLRTLCVRRVALRVPGVTQSNIFWIFFPLNKYCMSTVGS